MRSQKRIVLAGTERRSWRGTVDIITEGECREGAARLPCRRESRCPGLAALEGEDAVRLLEFAAGQAAQDDVGAEAQQHNILGAVIVDVDRIGAENAVAIAILEVKRGFLEFQGAARRRAIDEKAGRPLAAGDQHVLPAVAVAIEGGDAAADEELPRSAIGVIDAGALRLLDEGWHVAVETGRFDFAGGECRSGRQQGGDGNKSLHGSITRVLRKAISAERSSSEAWT